MADQDGKNQRHAAKGQFTRKFTELTKSVKEDKGSEILRVNFKELNEAWTNVEAKHVMYDGVTNFRKYKLNVLQSESDRNCDKKARSIRPDLTLQLTFAS